MIIWKEMAGVGSRITTAGYTIEQRFDTKGAVTWVTSDDAAVQKIIDGYTLAEAQAFVYGLIYAHAAPLFAAIAPDYTSDEKVLWLALVNEAAIYAAKGQAATDADAPNIAQEALFRGIPTAAMVAKVSMLSAIFAPKRSAIAGARGKHCDAINACTTHDQINAYDWRAGWPA